ncbi:stalk domain-containing protein [Brevibacillus centrosporus]|uniref:stalk domain-containing protein n=2 Tax=Brevibacillus centrosporus TaxID=54910 RepID=UPI002E210CDD|nr:stalk domain-containing protein [Brevibacillus centrosporus]
MKKFVCGFLIGGFLFGSINAFAEPLYQIAVSFNVKDIVVNGNSLPLANRPINYNGITYAPVRAIAESLGYEAKWNAEDQSVEINKAKMISLVTLDMVKQAIKEQGLPLNDYKLSYYTLNKIEPVSYQIGEMEHVHIYIYKSYEDRIRGRMEFEVIQSKTDMNVPFIYEAGNALIFYVPFKKELQLDKKMQAATAHLLSSKE